MRKHKLSGLFLLAGIISACSSPSSENEKPNIIYILADDLGYGDLGCYGQEKIKTPHIDHMAAEGMRFTHHYSGSTVCAPSRSSLLTGMHTGHTYIRGNREIKPEGQHPLPSEAYTIGKMMQEAGYVTGAFGKWGLGMHDSEGSPNAQGFDEFFGYLCQRYAHRYYPTYLWHNDKKVFLEGNDWSQKIVYAPDVIQEHTLDFIRNNFEKPFFLYVPHIIPHAELIAPDDSFTQMYMGKFPEIPFGFNNTGHPLLGNEYGAENFDISGYAPQSHPKAVFAAMISRLDHHVGEILNLIQELGIAENTLIIFTSDNGPHLVGGADPDFFKSAGPFRGYKRDLYEGGIRVPHIAWWPGKIQPGSVTDHRSAFWDVMPTLAELAGREQPIETDGISYLPTLLNKGIQKQHEFLYWEFHELGGRMALIEGDWKLVRYNVLHPQKITTELFNLRDDITESNNLADKFPEIVKEMFGKMKELRTPSDVFTFEPVF